VNEILNGVKNTNDFEFIEIFNTDPVHAVDVSRLVAAEGVNCPFSNIVLPPLGYGLMIRDYFAFTRRYGSLDPSTVLLCVFAERLGDTGENVVFTTDDDVEVTSLSFSYSAPNSNNTWPILTNGLGYTLVVSSPSSKPDLSDPNSWRHSTCMHGSPGTADPTDESLCFVESSTTAASTTEGSTSSSDESTTTEEFTGVAQSSTTASSSSSTAVSSSSSSASVSTVPVVCTEEQFRCEDGSGCIKLAWFCGSLIVICARSCLFPVNMMLVINLIFFKLPLLCLDY
jgi:hypothetical protein